MKNNHLLWIVLSLSAQLSLAQFVDDMEWAVGGCPDHWTTWTGTDECPIIATGGGHTGEQSGYIGNDGVTDNILDLGSRIFDNWYLQFWMYVPLGREGYFNIQGEVPVGAGEWVVGNFFFNQDAVNPGVGIIDDTALGEITFNFPHDQWFKIDMNIDLSSSVGASEWGLTIDNVLVIPPGTPFTNEAGDYPTSLGGIDFFSVSPNTEFYFDDFCFGQEPLNCFIAGVDEFGSNSFKLFPNPAKTSLFIQSIVEISKINVYSKLGQLILSQDANLEIDVTHLNNGLYFVEVETSSGKGIQKFIKQ